MNKYPYEQDDLECNCHHCGADNALTNAKCVGCGDDLPGYVRGVKQITPQEIDSIEDEAHCRRWGMG